MPPPIPDPAMTLPALARAARLEPAAGWGLEEEILGLFEQYRGGLLRYLYSMAVRDHDAEEVVQEVFLALFRHLRAGKPRTNLRGWIFRVAHNLGLKQRTATRRSVNSPDSSIFDGRVDPLPNPEQRLNAQQRQEQLMAVFQALPEQDRCCLSLRSEGLRYRDIAAALGISLGSVAQSLARSLDKMSRADRRL